MKLFEIHHPFPNSVEQRVLYHGTKQSFATFKRPPHGIYVTPVRAWAEEHYGSNIISLYANTKNIKRVSWDDPASDAFYDRDYDTVAKLLKKLSAQGYDAVDFGGESESIALIGDVEIVDAETGDAM
jgi:hypothetical protein